MRLGGPSDGPWPPEGLAEEPPLELLDCVGGKGHGRMGAEWTAFVRRCRSAVKAGNLRTRSGRVDSGFRNVSARLGMQRIPPG